MWRELRGRPAGGEWVYYQTHFVAAGTGEHEGKILVLDENTMKAEWFPADRVRVKLSTPAEMGSRQPKTPKTKGMCGSRSPASTPGSAQKQIGPICPQGLLREKVFCRTRDAEWFCIVAYARLSEDAQDLDKFLCDTFLEKVKDAAQREACRRQSGGRFTEAYMTWVVLAGANPGAQVIDGLNETKLTYKSVDHLAALMQKRREAVMSTTTDQRLCWEALRVLTKGVDTERDSETKQVLVRLRVMSLSEFLKDPTHGAELYDTVQAGLEEFIRSRATQAAILRSEEGQRQPKVYDTEGQVDPRWDDPEQRRAMKRLSCGQFVMGQECHKLLKQYCWRMVFLGNCLYGDLCRFAHDAEG